MEVVLVLRQTKSWAILLSGNMVFTTSQKPSELVNGILLSTTYNVQSVSALITSKLVDKDDRNLIDGAICFFALHRAAMLCSCYVFLDVVPSTSCNAKISRTNATIGTVISFFWRFDKIPSFLVLFFKCLISAPSIWSRCRGGRSYFQILFFQTFTKNSRTAHMCLLQWPPL